MKVLQINTFGGRGSTGRIATDLADVLKKNGHDSCIAFGRGSVSSDYQTIKIGNKISILLHVFKTRLYDAHGFGSKSATYNLIDQIKTYNPDIIQLHNVHGYYLNIEILFNYLKESNIPVVWLLHDAWSISGHSAHFKLDSNGGIPSSNLTINQKKEYPKSFINNSAKNYIKKQKIFTSLENLTIVTPSNWLKNLVSKSYLSKYNNKVIHNGIDLEKFTNKKSNFRKQYNLQDKKIILGVANVWTPKKGINIFKKLSEELDDSFQIVLVGVDKKTNKSLNNRIISINHTNSVDELAEIYSEADIFVNPTYEDNFPTTNIEALACGTPVITFDTGGSGESLNNEVGKLIPQDNYYELLKSIKELVLNEQLSKKCIKRAHDFNKEEKFKEYLQLYNTLISTSITS